MKHIYFILVSLTFTTVAFTQQTINMSVNVGNVKREFRIYVPKLYTDGIAVPLVFNFHGYTSNNTQQELYGDFRPVADTANFIVVHPLGLPVIGTSLGWNNFVSNLNSKPDDIGFFHKMIDTLSTIYSIDKNRIYSTGMSNGGFMSYDLACFASEKIAAIASVTGSMIQSHLSACQAKHPTPILEIHGTTDPVIPYDGKGFLVQSVHIDSLISFWVKFNQCSPTPTIAQVPNTNTADNCTAEHYIYANGKKGVNVEFYKIINGGHTWPSAPINLPNNGNTNRDINASTVIWNFFKKYSLNNLTTVSANQSQETKDISIYPNPTADKLNIIQHDDSKLSIIIYAIDGKILYKSNLSQGVNIIDVASLPSGMVFYTIMENTNMVKQGKIVIVK